MPRPPRIVRALTLALVSCSALGCGAAWAAPAPGHPTAGAGGTAIGAEKAGSGVHIVKSTSGRSCTGYSSQSTPPASIRVLVHNSSGTTTGVVTLPFAQYVENVLPHEWISGWNAEALKAGAVAVKSYAWFWVTHYGGYLNQPSNCFDVTDDTSFQVYRPNSAIASTTNAVVSTWNVVARKSGQVMQASYICSLPFTSGKTNCSIQGPKEKCGVGANGSQLSQYGSQACAVKNMPYQTILKTYYSPSLELATATSNSRQLLTPNDFSFQGRRTPATFHTTTGSWTLATDPSSPYHFGTTGDIPTTTNAGDGRATIGVFRPTNGTWYLADTFSGGTKTVVWGARGDVPVAAHYRGVSSPSVLATFRPSNGRWYLTGGGSVDYGQRGDIPTPGHFAGTAANGYVDQPAVFRPSSGTRYLLNVGKVRWGTKGDIPVPGDYDGDGKTDVAVYRPAVGVWYLNGHASMRFGEHGDIPVTGDYNGDGKTDIAVYRPSTGQWYVRGYAPIKVGSGGELPIGAAPGKD